MSRVVSGLIAMALLMSGAEEPAAGAQTERVTHDTYEDWQRGTPDGVTIGWEGTLFPGFVLDPVTNLTALGVETVWSAAAGAEGSVILGTGPKGGVVRLDGGQARLLTNYAEGQIYAVERGPGADVFVATSPNGRVYRLPIDGGTGTVFFDPEDATIWDLQWASGALYVATGPKGKLYRVTEEGVSSLAYESDEPNLRSLAVGPDGKLLIGTDGAGLLLRLEADGRALALFDAPHPEVRTIAIDRTGRIALAAAGRETRGGEKKARRAAPRAKGEGGVEGAGDGPSAGGPVVMTAFNAQQAQAQSEGGVYVLEEPGFARPIWRGDKPAQSLMRWGNEWLIGTHGGRLVAVDDWDRERVIAEAGGDAVTVLTMDRDGHVKAATSNEAEWLNLVEPDGGRRFRSEVIDAGALATWGAIRVTGEGRLRTRSGNSADPDRTWHEWQAVPPSGKVPSPPARFLQYEASLERGGIRAIDVFFVPRNLRPMVSDVFLVEAGVGYQPVTDPPQPMPQKTVDQIVGPNVAGMPGMVRPEMGQRLAPLEKPSYQTLGWRASDPNQDELRFELSYKRELEHEEAEGGWTVLAEELDMPVFSMDTAGWPDGSYVFRVVATDEVSRPFDAQRHEAQSDPIVFDNSPPRILSPRTENGTVVVRIEDETSLLDQVLISTNGLNFMAVLPEDGVLDSGLEVFRIEAPRDVSVFIRAVDERGNESSAHRPGSGQ